MAALPSIDTLAAERRTSSIQQLAERYERSTTAMRRVLCDRGIRLRQHRDERRHSFYLKHWREDDREIAKFLGIALRCFRQWKRENGYDTLDRRGQFAFWRRSMFRIQPEASQGISTEMEAAFPTPPMQLELFHEIPMAA